MNMGSHRVVVKPPYKKYIHLFRETKSKVGKRMIRVKRFIGWGEWLQDGEVVEDKFNKIFFMNQATFNELKKLPGIDTK